MTRRAAALRRAVLPWRRASIGLAAAYVGVMVVAPMVALAVFAAQTPWTSLARTLAETRTLAALGLSFGAALAAALLCVPLGLLVAWALVRLDLPARRLWDALLDVPFAVPTAAAGIALAQLWSPTGWLGRWADAVGLQVAYARPGILLALLFVGLPFVVRAVQPVLAQLPREPEEAAATLGASRAQIFWRVTLPALRGALWTGFALALARGAGEYGAVIFIAGNQPVQTEIAPLLIVARLESFDVPGAAALALVMLAGSLAALTGLQLLQRAQQGARDATP